ncbi:MAG TPA: nuclear transport factor 2 family protein [Gemmatimonadaceae bacterium]|jgi:ketosteroid isomerase-like protein|nr:nuclear transport factor 2 family protein [Gemmatimonadaceae bacterium]
MAQTRLIRLLTFIVAITACSPARERAPVDVSAEREAIAGTMERYMVYARQVNADSVATFFTPNGTLFEPGIFPIQTRDSIRAFMASFPGARVEVATATPDTIEVFGDTALLWGSYFERLAFPGQPLSEQHGKFVIEWRRQPGGAWLIHRYYRVPLPAAPAPR